MSKSRKEIGGTGLGQPDPDNMEELGQHPNASMCKCGHSQRKHDEHGICEKARFCNCTGFERAAMELVVTKPEHQKEYELIRQMGGLPSAEWPDARILAVRQMFASAAQNTAQLAVFMSIASRHGLDPALNEIQLIPTGQGPKCYSGRDGFLKSASRQPHMYSGIQSGVVYPQDEFFVVVKGTDIEVNHTWSPSRRSGRPHGAYAIAYDGEKRPTYVYRETAKCQQLKSDYWRDEKVDEAIHNRALASALRRVVPLGGLLIHGEEPIGSVEDREKQTESSTRRRLNEIQVKLGLAKEEVPVSEAGEPDPEEIDRLLDEYAEQYQVTPHAFLAWARNCGSVPDQLEEWSTEHKTLALQVMSETEGMDMVKELANELAEKVADLDERLEILTAVANCQDRAKLDEIVVGLWERRGQK